MLRPDQWDGLVATLLTGSERIKVAIATQRSAGAAADAVALAGCEALEETWRLVNQLASGASNQDGTL